MTRFDFTHPRPMRRPSLTPMVDVVFLLLVFFMLAARFGSDTALVLTPAGSALSAAEWDGPPRLIQLSGTAVTLNGVATTPEKLIADLPALMKTPQDPILLRATQDVALQALIDFIEQLQSAGFPKTLLVE